MMIGSTTNQNSSSSHTTSATTNTSSTNNNDDTAPKNPFTNIFGDDEDSVSKNGSHNATNSDNTHSTAANNNSLITPDILLEQLAYVDNFIPTINQDFMNLDSWILNESENNSSKNKENPIKNDGHNQNTVSNNVSSLDSVSDNNLNTLNLLPNNPFGLDEQLAVELSAFADDAFIFADEEKPANNSNNGINDNSRTDNKINNNNINNSFEFMDHHNSDTTTKAGKNSERTNSHFLTQRKNTFLTSQYDNSKARYSSKNNKLRSTMESLHNNDTTDKNTTNNHNFNGFHSDSDSDDSHNHDRFISSDVHHNNSSNNNKKNSNNATSIENIQSISPHLSSLLQAVPDKNNTNENLNISTVSSPNVIGLNIEMPDFSSIPTISLVASLPRITVPPNVQQTLIKSGFRQEQIDALSAIIAYNENEKAQSKKMNKSNGIHTSLADTNKLIEKLDNLSDSNPLKKTSRLLFSLLQNEINKNKEVLDNINANTSRSNSSKLDPDYINSLIESRNREVNNLKNKLDKESVEQKHENDLSNHGLSDNIVNSNFFPNDESNTNYRKRSSSSFHNEGISRANSASNSLNGNYPKRKFKGKELEESIQELTNLATTLQQKITTLELENKLLKDLVNNSGELKGLERAESIKQDLLKRVNGNK